jgi:hypothetical protein
MKKSILWMLAAILFCGLTTTVLTSCGSDDDNDPPVSGLYIVQASQTKRIIPEGESTLAQLAAKYDQQIKTIVGSSVHQWNVNTKQSQLNTALTVNNERALAYFKTTEAQLKALKVAFDAENKTGMKGYMILEVTLSADQTVTGQKVVPDAVFRFEYEDLQGE